MNNVKTLKEKFQAVVAKNMIGLKLADVTIMRAKRMMELAAPFANDDLVVEQCIEMVTEKLTDPDQLFKDSIIINDVVYPEIMDESLYEEAMAGFVQHMEWLPADGKATVAAIAIWCGEAMLNAA